MTTKIEWTQETWNPVVGCSKVSPGCEHCYAERFDRRRRGDDWKPWTAPNAVHNVRLHPDRLERPLHWRKPRWVFVNSMSDLFHEQVPQEFVVGVFAVMAACPQHTFQILTKRPERMRETLNGPGFWSAMCLAVDHLVQTGKVKQNQVYSGIYYRFRSPLPNVWLGVSVEDQRRADERIPLLLQTPAAVRFLSCEPLLGPVDIPYLARCEGCGEWLDGSQIEHGDPDVGPCGPRHPQIDWVIVGSESGPGARPMEENWVRSLRDQCQVSGVAFFYKQRLDEKGRKVSLPFLDGQQWAEMPGVRA